jgi:hypothetical protein
MEPAERWQPIAPASDDPAQQRAPPDGKKRRQAIAVACVQCRGGKVKVGVDILTARCSWPAAEARTVRWYEAAMYTMP